MADGDEDGVPLSVGLGEELGLDDGLGDSEVALGLAVGLGVTVGVAVGSVVGSVNCCTGEPSSAAFMKAVQMRVGNEPPVTEFMPPVPDSETGFPSAPSLTNMTAAARSGV